MAKYPKKIEMEWYFTAVRTFSFRQKKIENQIHISEA